MKDALTNITSIIAEHSEHPTIAGRLVRCGEIEPWYSSTNMSSK